MLMPSIFGENLFDDFFDYPFVKNEAESNGLMKTDDIFSQVCSWRQRFLQEKPFLTHQASCNNSFLPLYSPLIIYGHDRKILHPAISPIRYITTKPVGNQFYFEKTKV